jgi:hypothetical protein
MDVAGDAQFDFNALCICLRVVPPKLPPGYAPYQPGFKPGFKPSSGGVEYFNVSFDLGSGLFYAYKKQPLLLPVTSNLRYSAVP